MLTVKEGLIVDQTAKDAVNNACGDLGKAARGTDNAQIVAGWGEDQFKNETDPHNNKKYGLHVTVETFSNKARTGRWHVYESGAVWVDPKADGKNSVYSCNS
jgi:hypothetical protein